MRLINTEEAYNTSMDRDVAAEWLYIEAAKEAQQQKEKEPPVLVRPAPIK